MTPPTRSSEASSSTWAMWQVSRRGRPESTITVAAWAESEGLLHRLANRVPRRVSAEADRHVDSAVALAEASVFVVCLTDALSLAWRHVVEAVLAGASTAPVVLVCWFSVTEAWRITTRGPAHLVFPEVGVDFEQIFAELTLGQPVSTLERRIFRLSHPSPVTVGAMREVCRRSVDGAASSEELFESVSELAIAAGCGASFLYRDAKRCGVNLGAFVRSVRVISGLRLYERQPNWCRIGVRLGFASASAWSNFVRRHWGLSPSEAYARGETFWVSRALVAVFGEDPASTAWADGAVQRS